MNIVIVSLIYLAGTLFTHCMIVDSNIPDTNPQPGSPDDNPNLSPVWSLVWPLFWLKTIPIFCELHHEETDTSN